VLAPSREVQGGPTLFQSHRQHYPAAFSAGCLLATTDWAGVQRTARVYWGSRVRWRSSARAYLKARRL